MALDERISVATISAFLTTLTGTNSPCTAWTILVLLQVINMAATEIAEVPSFI